MPQQSKKLERLNKLREFSDKGYLDMTNELMQDLDNLKKDIAIARSGEHGHKAAALRARRLSVEIEGRFRVWRKMSIQVIG